MVPIDPEGGLLLAYNYQKKKKGKGKGKEKKRKITAGSLSLSSLHPNMAATLPSHF